MDTKNRAAFLDGPRVEMRAPEEDDVPTLYSLFNNWEVVQNLASVRPISRQGEKEWIENLAKDKDSQVVFAVVLKETGELMGTMGLHRIDWVNRTAVTGSALAKKFHGNGYGTEAKLLLLRYAFHTLGLRKIKSEVYGFNENSIRCLKKCGYAEDGGPRKKDVFRNGEYQDMHQFAVFREDFEKAWEAKFGRKTL